MKPRSANGPANGRATDVFDMNRERPKQAVQLFGEILTLDRPAGIGGDHYDVGGDGLGGDVLLHRSIVGSPESSQYLDNQDGHPGPGVWGGPGVRR